MEKLKTIFLSIISLVVLSLVILFFSNIVKPPPDNLLILVDHHYETYESPECLNPHIDYDDELFEVVELRYAKNILGYRQSSSCTYESLYPTRGILWNFVGVKLGLIKPLGWKWNEDGTWNESIFK